jgi:hypothetical protein
MWEAVSVCIGFTLSMMAAHEVGYRLARYIFAGKSPFPSEGLGVVVPVALSMTGLLIAFSFGMAENRYELRRVLLVAEANAISTANYRQQLLASPERDRLAPLKRDYASTRLRIVARRDSARETGMAWSHISDLQDKIWQVTGVALQTREGNRISLSLLLATNAMFDASEDHRAAMESKIPPRAIRVLVLLVLGTAGLTGLVLGLHGPRLRLVSSLTFALMALAISLIWDLDTARAGGISNPANSLERVVEQLSRP